MRKEKLFIWMLMLTCAMYMLVGCKKKTPPTKKGANQAKGAKKDYAGRMAKEHKRDKPVAAPSTLTKPKQPVTGEEVTYGKGHKGYLAQPKAASKEQRPGLLVIHEWWGLNDNIKAMTRRLAGEGYVALAVDLYQGKSASTPKKAYRLMKGAMKRAPALRQNLKEAFAYLKKKSTKIASIGWCFGGAWSLQTGLLLPKKLDAMVIYYGRLVTEKKKLKPLAMPILGIFGGQDKGIPVASVKKFEAALKSLKKDATIHIYKDANHAFANPSGTRYRKADAEDAWKHTTAFLAKHLE